MTRTEVSNMQDVIDSRDVIARIEELQGFRDDAKTTAEEKQARIDVLDAQSERTEPEQDEVDDCRDYLTENTATDAKGNAVIYGLGYGEDEHNELTALESLQEEASGSADWTYGETLIRDSYFKDYAQELAEDCGMLKDTDSWPGRCIDWEMAARELQQDYMQVDFDGVEYWIRA